ncbi:MAG: hypothetical protein JRK53_06105 [Deltaproteobacteria bacterium]|nr:hypothetical protein [Deltaproteobacteria bacterium]
MNRINRTSNDQGTAFFGKMTAGISHELMNILAIIRERSGLIEDLMALDKEADFPYRDKLAATLTSIREQVGRGMQAGEKLNRLAHSTDESRARLQVDDLLDRIAFLMQRFTRLEKIEIKVVPTEPPMTVDTDPFRILLVLAACIEYCMDRTTVGGEIVLQCMPTQGGTAIRCSSDRGPNPVEGAETIQHLQDRLRDPMERLGAQLCVLSADNQVGLELILP